MERPSRSRPTLPVGMADLHIELERDERTLLNLFVHPARFFAASRDELPRWLLWLTAFLMAVPMFATMTSRAYVTGDVIDAVAFGSGSAVVVTGVSILFGTAWMKIRLRFCGVGDATIPSVVRVYLATNHVQALPNAILSVWGVLSATGAIMNPSAWGLMLLAELFAVWTAYHAAIEVYDVKRAPAVFWFLALPILLTMPRGALPFLAGL